MKQNDLIVVLKKYLNKEMRKIVREEIKYSFDKEMRSVIREELELLGDLEFSTKKSLQDAVITTDNEEYESIVPKTRPVGNIKFSNNPLLNDILAETAREATPISEKTDFASMMESEVASSESPVNTKPVNRPTDPRPTKKPDIREMIPLDKRGRDIPDFLQNVLTRDYSELTKAMSKPKGPSGHMPGAGLPPLG